MVCFGVLQRWLIWYEASRGTGVECVSLAAGLIPTLGNEKTLLGVFTFNCNI